MRFYRLVSIMIVFAGLSLAGQAASDREVITTSQIATAIRAAGLQVSAEQVTLLSDVVAKTRTPVLSVESISPWEGNLARVRLNCVSSEECLPFVVTMRRHPTNEVQRVSVASDLSASPRSLTEVPRSKVVVHIGSSAVLLLDGGHVHIQLAVICLENGSVGQIIRVTGRAHERTYIAEVCSDGLLRGTL